MLITIAMLALIGVICLMKREMNAIGDLLEQHQKLIELLKERGDVHHKAITDFITMFEKARERAKAEKAGEIHHSKTRWN